MNELEDIFKTNEFKALPWKQRFWVRVKVAIAGEDLSTTKEPSIASVL